MMNNRDSSRLGVWLWVALLLASCHPVQSEGTSSASPKAVPSYHPDGGWSTDGYAKEYGSPCGIAVDGQGCVYVAGDEFGHGILKFTSQGRLLARWGSTGSGPAELCSPAGLAVDPAGNVLVADSYHQRVQKFTSDGRLLTKWTAPDVHRREFFPSGIAVDATGCVYVTSEDCFRIWKFTSGGQFLKCWGRSLRSGEGNDIGNSGYAGIAVDANGVLYVVNVVSDEIERYAKDGRRLPNLASIAAGSVYPAVGPDENIYIPNRQNETILVFSPKGSRLAQIGGAGNGPGQFESVSGVAFDRSGNLYVTDPPRCQVRKFRSDNSEALAHSAAGQSARSAGNTAKSSGVVILAVDADGKLSRFAVNGDKVELQSSHQVGNVLSPLAVSVDGKYVCWRGRTGEGSGDLFVAPLGQLDSGRRLTQTDDWSDAWWAPDGKTIIAARSKKGYGNLGLCRIDTTSGKVSPVMLLEDAFCADSPRVSPDGSMVAVHFSRHYDAVEVAGLETSQGSTGFLATGFSSSADWSPDGKTLLVGSEGVKFDDEKEQCPSGLWVFTIEQLKKIMAQPSDQKTGLAPPVMLAKTPVLAVLALSNTRGLAWINTADGKGGKVLDCSLTSRTSSDLTPVAPHPLASGSNLLWSSPTGDTVIALLRDTEGDGKTLWMWQRGEAEWRIIVRGVEQFTCLAGR